MDNLGFTEPIQAQIFRVLAIILHLGNITFEAAEDASKVKAKTPLENSASLMDLPIELLEKGLTTRTSVTRGETFVTPLNVNQAADSREALAKALYSYLFGWLVRCVNEKIEIGKATAKFSIGVLDIFGFEDFQKNSFEQMCINYANERLQQFFNMHIFKLEQEEYKKEGINVSEVTFIDNQPCLDLISKRPIGLLALLDEETSIPKGTDKTFIQKIATKFEGQNMYFDKDKKSDITFMVVHYAGRVTYNAEGFLDKNRDQLRADLEKLCLDSKFKFIAELILTGNTADMEKKDATMKLSGNAAPSGTVRGSPSGSQSAAATRKTAGARFDESLAMLVAILNSCHPHFIRCIKPNMAKKSDIFEDDMVLAQLRYSGVLETVRIRQTGFPVRRSYEDFYKRYRCLIKRPEGTPRQITEKFLLGIPDIKKNLWQAGNTRVFYREALETVIEKQRTAIRAKMAVTIQRYYRGHRLRSKFHKKKNMAIKIQRVFRGYRKRKSFIRKKRAAKKIQSFARGIKARREIKNIKASLAIVQAAMRTQLARASIAWLSGQVRAARQVRDYKEANATAMAIMKVFEESYVTFIGGKSDSKDADAFKACFTPAFTVPSMNLPLRFKNSSWYTNDAEQGNYDFAKFISAYCVNSEETFSPTPIKNPVLAKLPEQLSQDATAIFCNIMILMNDLEPPPSSTSSAIDRLQFILKKGISIPELRDEILVQTCKQLAKHPKPENAALGWRLLAMFFSCFSPSDTLSKYIYFIADSAPGPMSTYMKTLLRRAVESGGRKIPPTVQEIISLSKGEKRVAEVEMPDKTVKQVPLELSVTASDVLGFIMDELNVTSYPGWNLVTMQNDNHVIIDPKRVIYESDASATQAWLKTGNELFPTKFNLRKETLEPGEVLRDEKLVDLVYIQILKLIKESPFHIEDSTAGGLIAFYAMINGGQKSDAICAEELFAESLRKELKMEDVAVLVANAQENHSGESPLVLKRNFINTASEIAGLFGKRFKVDLPDTTMQLVFAGKSPKQPPFEISMDRRGIHILSMPQNIEASISYLDLMYDVSGDKLNLRSAKGVFEFHSAQARAIHEAITKNIEGLLKVSTWAIAVEDHQTGGDETMLPLAVGDIVEIWEHKSLDPDWLVGENKSLTMPMDGWFPKKCVKILVAEPETISTREYTPDLLSSTAAGGAKGPNAADPNAEKPLFSSACTLPLMDYAMTYFRQEASSKRKSNAAKMGTVRGTLRRLTGGDKDGLTNDVDSIKERLQFRKTPSNHAAIKLNSDEERIAIDVNVLIMKFMGDYPLKDGNTAEIARSIVNKSRDASPTLRNEIFIQLIRQMVENPTLKNTQKGLSLLKLVSSYFGPSADLLALIGQCFKIFIAQAPAEKETFHTIERNLATVTRLGGRRYPASVEEITFQQLNRPLSVQIHFVDKSSKKLMITPCTTVVDAVYDLCKKLDIKEVMAYGLYYNSNGDDYLMFPEEFILDGLNGPDQGKKGMTRRLFLRRVIWEKSKIPESSLEINLMFHQVIQLHLSNNNRVTLGECTAIAAFQLLVMKTEFSAKSPEGKEDIVRSLVPSSMYVTIKPDVWVREIEGLLQKYHELTPQQAQVAVLKIATNWTFFGAHIMHVTNPKCDGMNLPDEIMIALTLNGVMLVNRSTKQPIVLWSYKEISTYSAGVDRVNIKLGGMMEKDQMNFKAYTVQGREICQILNIYAKKALK